jgi:glycosyltransferase involved in cell wall biosynthesis
MADAIETIEISDPSKLPVHPLVSVYTLAYRHEKFIAQTIEGVIAQKCDFPIELIIGEDCSPDRTREIVLDYQRRYSNLIRVLTSNVNVGGLANGARCRAACRGTFIAICEGDDFWHHPGKLQMQVDVMLSDPSITLCHTDYDRLIGRRRKRNCHSKVDQRYLADGPNAYANLLHHWSVMTATSMYRSDLLRRFERSPFNNAEWPFGDYNKALFAAANGRVVYLPVSTAVWRKVAGSATNDAPWKTLKIRLAALACREAFMAKYPVDDRTRCRSLCFANRFVMTAAFAACNHIEFDAAHTRMLSLDCCPMSIRDRLCRAALKLRFPAHVCRVLRSALLWMTAHKY